MINMQSVFVANGAALMILITITMSAKKPLQHCLTDEKIFYMMVLSTVFQCILETFALMIDGNTTSGYRTVALVLNTILFCNNILFAFLWTIYADYKLFGRIDRLKKYYPFIAIPALLVCLGSMINLFVPVFFRISMENVYERTALYGIPFAITYLYLAYGVILIYQYKNKVNKYLFMPAILFMIPILFGSVLQFLFYGLSLVWLGVSIALLTLYINVQNEISYVDNLSGLFTRQYMNLFIEAEVKRNNSKKRLGGIMLDIDKFKVINDKFGHLTGDEAIQSAGRILLEAVPEEAMVFRYAGDEFMVLLHISREEEILDVVKQIEESTKKFNAESGKPYQIRFSQGYTVYDRRGDSMDQFLGRVDQAMYREKNRVSVSEETESGRGQYEQKET